MSAPILYKTKNLITMFALVFPIILKWGYNQAK